jgi:poly(hydroxyalkanoate) depolymerase family esterase
MPWVASSREGPRRCGRRATWALVVALLACVPGVAAAAPDPPDPGQTTSGTVTSNGTDYEYLLYTPTSYVPGRAAPLLVMVHGCQTTAEQQLKANLYNPIAEREGFVVLYPDVDALGRAQPGPANQCWKFPYPPSWSRDNSDAAGIADMTRAVMAKMAIDPERVYLVGMSAGGFMTSIEAAAYPDLFAAVGISAAGAYADAACTGTGTGIPVTTSAQLAFDQMGPRARIVPRFVIGGDADQGIPPACADKAFEQGLRTNNLVLGASQDGPIALTPAAVRKEQKPGGYAYTVKSYRDPAGCLIGERWLVHGMNHFWSGGTTDPKYASFTDPKGPSGAEASWAFLKRYRRSDTAMPCAEAPAVRATCPARTVTVTLARGARVRSVLASVAGRRVHTTIRGRRVTLTLPSGRNGAVSVVLRVRRQGRSRPGLVRRTFARC